MASRDFARADAIGHFKELVELDEVVAKRAGNRRAAGQIVGNERLDDLLFEALFEIHHVIGNAKNGGNKAGIVDIIKRTAAAGCAALGREMGQTALIPELHSQANNRVPLALQETSDNGAIDSARHCDGYGGVIRQGEPPVHGVCLPRRPRHRQAH